ncbi:hypothetical protein [Actinocatenispora rupis]|uniref:Uncharacterized protein n=1 Tax=Actinocatenispora rupis TaxID=519421 RepID=A0A8J3J275_9ACTN|nr:hypothetical protein [Actinocatenispora rupis]GID10652.1 hypothetical protein Aru02nite_15410 [Actinocatenispora rupis]
MTTPPEPADGTTARREPPAELVAEIDGTLIGDPDGYVPGEAVRGVWRVGADGRLTGEFEPNPRYGTVQDDFTALTDGGHWLDWLGDDPAAALRQSVAEILDEQVPGAAVRWMRITEEPRYLTAGRRRPEDPDRIVVTRAALAAPFAVGVDSPDRFDVLWGVHSIAVAGLDRPDGATSRVWFDLWTDADTAEEQLRERITTLDP